MAEPTTRKNPLSDRGAHQEADEAAGSEFLADNDELDGDRVDPAGASAENPHRQDQSAARKREVAGNDPSKFKDI
jgi:hypothetical protein